MHPDTDNYRFIAHGLSGFQNDIQIPFICRGSRLTCITPVDKILTDIAPCNAFCSRRIRFIRTILQRYRQITVSPCLCVLPAVPVGKRAFYKYQSEISFLRFLRPVKPGCHALPVRLSHFLFGIHSPEKVLLSLDEPLRHINLFPPGNRKRPCPTFFSGVCRPPGTFQSGVRTGLIFPADFAVLKQNH